jgi:hypothetical protein
MPVPTALVTGAPEWVSHVAIALKSEGFDILSAGEEGPLAPGSVDCYVQVGASRPPSEPATRARSNGPRLSWRSYLDEEPELGFADWRDEVLCLTSSTS